MTVVVRMRNGDSYRLDRRLYQEGVVAKISAKRGTTFLVELELDSTLTGQKVWVDPDEVVAIEDDRSGW